MLREINNTIKPARTTPKNIAIKLFFQSNLSSQDNPEPVHAPVNGKGIATITTNPKKPYLSILSLCFEILSKHLLTILKR